MRTAASSTSDYAIAARRGPAAEAARAAAAGQWRDQLAILCSLQCGCILGRVLSEAPVVSPTIARQAAAPALATSDPSPVWSPESPLAPVLAPWPGPWTRAQHCNHRPAGTATNHPHHRAEESDLNISTYQHPPLAAAVNSPRCVNSRMSAVPRAECGGTRP